MGFFSFFSFGANSTDPVKCQEERVLRVRLRRDTHVPRPCRPCESSFTRFPEKAAPRSTLPRPALAQCGSTTKRPSNAPPVPGWEVRSVRVRPLGTAAPLLSAHGAGVVLTRRLCRLRQAHVPMCLHALSPAARSWGPGRPSSPRYGRSAGGESEEQRREKCPTGPERTSRRAAEDARKTPPSTGDKK